MKYFIGILMVFNLLNFSHSQSKEDEFWNWFLKNEKRIYNFELNQENIFDDLDIQLKKVYKTLIFEFGPIESNVREFVISADGDIEAFPYVHSLKEKEPKKLNYFYVTYFRPRNPEIFTSITFDDLTLSVEDISYELHLNNNKIDIILSIRNYKENIQEKYYGPVFIILDHTLGEYDMVTKVGEIYLQSSKSKESNFKDLQNEFDKLVKELSTKN